MKEYIIKPIEIVVTNDIEKLIESFNLKSKFIVCAGKEKVGKTAFSYKLLNRILSDENKVWKPLFIGMDKPLVYEYWNDKFREKIDNKKAIEAFGSVPFVYPFVNEQPVEYLTTIIDKHKPSLIIVDGFDSLLKIDESAEDKRLIIKLYFLYSLLMNVFVEHKTTIIITWRNNYNINRKQHKAVPITYWELNRPEYLVEEITDYGATLLKIIE